MRPRLEGAIRTAAVAVTVLSGIGAPEASAAPAAGTTVDCKPVSAFSKEFNCPPPLGVQVTVFEPSWPYGSEIRVTDPAGREVADLKDAPVPFDVRGLAIGGGATVDVAAVKVTDPIRQPGYRVTGHRP